MTTSLSTMQSAIMSPVETDSVSEQTILGDSDLEEPIPSEANDFEETLSTDTAEEEVNQQQPDSEELESAPMTLAPANLSIGKKSKKTGTKGGKTASKQTKPTKKTGGISFLTTLGLEFPVSLHTPFSTIVKWKSNRNVFHNSQTYAIRTELYFFSVFQLFKVPS